MRDGWIDREVKASRESWTGFAGRLKMAWYRPLEQRLKPSHERGLDWKRRARFDLNLTHRQLRFVVFPYSFRTLYSTLTSLARTFILVRHFPLFIIHHLINGHNLLYLYSLARDSTFPFALLYLESGSAGQASCRVPLILNSSLTTTPIQPYFYLRSNK